MYPYLWTDNHSLPKYLFDIRKAWTNWEIFIDHQTATGPNPKRTTKR
jgi:hypothetical protein